MSNTLAQRSPAANPSAVDPIPELQTEPLEMRRFVETLFQNCVGTDGWISLRAFQHEGAGAAVVNRWTPFDETLVPTAAEVATLVANRSYAQRAVFAPPVCLFGDEGLTEGKRIASESNVVCAPTIAVELDERPAASLETLIAALGRPTLVVASGGMWCDPADVLGLEVQEKLHAYWRLAVPAASAQDRKALREARALAARLVAADTTAVPLAHPMRWAGSWHTKGQPARLCRIVGGDRRCDVDLQWATEALRAALIAAGLEAGGSGAIERGERLGFKTRQEWSALSLTDAARLIPNDGLHWTDWNRIGMAIYDAAHASVDGLDAFHAWSEKDDRYDVDTTNGRWSHWHSSPPSNLSAGTLLFECRKVDPQYNVRVDPADHFDHRALLEKGHVGAPAGSTARFAFEGFDELAGAAISQPSRPLIKGLLDQGAMTVLYGESNSGKTFVALDMAFHIATGRAWNEMRVTTAPVVYVAAEGGQGFAKRVGALRQKYGSPPAGRFHALRSPVNLLRADADADLVALVAAIRALPEHPGFVVLDTLSRVMAGGDENASTDMGALVRNLDAIRSATGAHLMVVHHTGKDRSKGARGHSLLRAATDTEIEIANGQILATKQRDIERNAAAAFVLDQVVLGVDLEGDPVTSAVVRILSAETAAAAPEIEVSEEDIELRQRIALAAYRALDGAQAASVRNKRRRLVDELSAGGVKLGASLPTLRDKIEWALAAGVTIEVDGQTVRMEAAKNGSGMNAPWTISTYQVPGEAHEVDAASYGTDPSAETGEGENDGK